MELDDAIRRRRMVRSFTGVSLDPSRVDHILDLARRAPSAGNTQAVGFVVLDTPDTVRRYWDTTLPAPKRTSFRWQDLITAPVLVLVTTRPMAYVDRYAEPDKARRGLGERLDAWSVPFWWVDAGTVVQNMLLLATAEGWGACLFGLFEHERRVAAEFEVDDDQRIVAAIALGWPSTDDPGRSAGRERPSKARVIRRPGQSS